MVRRCRCDAQISTFGAGAGLSKSDCAGCGDVKGCYMATALPCPLPRLPRLTNLTKHLRTSACPPRTEVVRRRRRFIRAQPAMSIFYAYEPHFTCNVWVRDWWEKLCEACWKPGNRGEKDLGQDGGYIIFIELRRRTTLVGVAVHKRFANLTSLLSLRTRRCPRHFGNDREQITAGHTLQVLKHAFVCPPKCAESELVLTRIWQCSSFR